MKAFNPAAILTAVIILAGCQAPRLPQPTKTPAPTVDRTPTIAPTYEPTITAVTPASTWTPSAAVFYPSVTPAPTTTEDLLNKLLPKCSETKMSVHPDWIYGICNSDETRLVNVTNSKTWSIRFSDYASNFDGGQGSINPVLWSADGLYVFLDIDWEVDGLFSYPDSWGLLRLELGTGRVTEILSPGQFRRYAISFSPGGAYLAYVIESERPLVLRLLDMHTGELKTFELPAEYHQAGAFLWSPDTAWLAYAQTTAHTLDDFDFSVAAVNLADGSRQTVVPDQPLDIRPAAWLNAYTLRLVDDNADSWIFDFRDHSLKPR